MPSYEQIYTLEKRLYNALSDIDSVVHDSAFHDVFDTAGKYIIESRTPTDYLRRKHDDLMCRLYTYVINQIPRLNALKMLLSEFKVEPVALSRLVNEIYIESGRDNLPCRVFAAHAMKKAGLTNKKIAVTLGVSAASVSHYLKIKTTGI